MMRRRQVWLLRISAIVCSIMLALGYVNYRATGRVVPSFLVSHADDAAPAAPAAPVADTGNSDAEQSAVAVDEQRLVFPGSKSSTIFTPESIDDEQNGIIMGGSKYGIVAEPEDFESPRSDDENESGDPQ